MTIPDHAKAIIGQAISESPGAYSLGRSSDRLQRVIDAIERDLESGDYVVISREDLSDRIEDGPHEVEYQDGQ